MKPSTMRRAYLREATLMLAVARVAVRFLPPARIFAWANRPQRHSRRFAADEARWVAWSIDTMSAKPWIAKAWIKGSCLASALAAHAMLRRRGIASSLCLGVARDEGAMAAHAWIEVGQDVIVGAAEAVRFKRIAQFGAAAARS
ncbi:MAG: lasso peptide biosynthesis B2 protein [Xanthobacteraceae bacterium]